MKILALIADTFREIYAKKVILGIIVIEVITLIITALILFSGGMQDMYTEAGQSLPPIADTAMVGAPYQEGEPDQPDSNQQGGNQQEQIDSSLLGGASDPLLDSMASDTTKGAESKTFDLGPGGGSLTPPEGEHQDGEHSRMLVEMVKGQMGAFGAVIALATIFLGIFATAGIVPSMMEKGTIDLLVSKPLPRAALLLGRAFGGLLALGINLAVFVFLMWALYGIATGVWHLPFLIWTFLIPLFTFVVIYSGIIALNVFTESWILPMSLAYVHLMILSNFLYGREESLYAFISSPALRYVIDGLYYILPQTNDLIRAVPTVIFTSNIDHALPFIQGGIFAVAMLGLALWKFEKKDF